VPLDGHPLELEPHVGVTAVGVHELAELLLHLQGKNQRPVFN
jgi:hypothetical protein